MEEVVKKEYTPEFDEDGKLKLRSIVDIVSDLKKPIHKSKLATRPQSGQDIVYVPWFNAVGYLDLYAPGWEYRIVDRQFVVCLDQKIECVLSVELTIHALEGRFTRSAVGTGVQEWDAGWTDKKTGKVGRWKPVYGGVAEIAESAALRRAASKLGLGLYLYDN